MMMDEGDERIRASYREGPHVRKRSIANLTHADPQEIAALELALKHKGDLAAFHSLDQIHLAQGLSLGAVWTVAAMARRFVGLRITNEPVPERDAGSGRPLPGERLWDLTPR